MQLTTKYAIANGNILSPGRIVENGCLLVQDGVIVDVLDKMPDGLPADWQFIDAKGLYISPGFIDLHVHGGGGSDVMDGTENALRELSAAHARYGTTALLPTTLACADEELFGFLELFQRVKHTVPGAKFLGVHLEGPYIHPDQKGALDERYIKNPESWHYRDLLRRSDDILRVSAAPELPGALPMAREMRERGILLSIAHTTATYEQVVQAVAAGFSHVTHLYSAMSGVRRVNAFRVAGVIEAALLMDELTVEIIADGVHLPAPLLKLIMKAKGAGLTALVTDAMRAAGMSDGESILGSLRNGLPVIVEDGVAKLPDRTSFAGSVATADRLVRTMVNIAGLDLISAVKMLTLTPARILGLDHRIGSILPGYVADIILFNDNIEVQKTMVSGKIVYPQSFA